MSVMRVKCPCGGELEIKGLGVREFDVDWWMKLHVACTKAGEAVHITSVGGDR